MRTKAPSGRGGRSSQCLLDEMLNALLLVSLDVRVFFVCVAGGAVAGCASAGSSKVSQYLLSGFCNFRPAKNACSKQENDECRCGRLAAKSCLYRVPRRISILTAGWTSSTLVKGQRTRKIPAQPMHCIQNSTRLISCNHSHWFQRTKTRYEKK